MTPSFSSEGVLNAVFAKAPKSQGGGRALMFVGARRGEGVSTIVRAAARAASQATTYCVDLDVRRNALARDFAAEGPMLGPKIDGKLNGSTFYAVLDREGGEIRELTSAFSYHRLGRTRAYVGAFANRAVPPNGRVLISSTPDYWNAARAGGALAIVDAPALERSQIALRVAHHMDGVVLVVGQGDSAAPAAIAAQEELLANGANLIGLVYTQASPVVMAMERVLARAS